MTKKKSFAKFIILLIVLSVIGMAFVFIYKMSESKYSDKGNQTINQTTNINQTNINNTIIQAGKSNGWDALKWSIFFVCSTIIIYVVVKHGFALIGGKSLLQPKSDVKCEKASYDELTRLGYSVHQKPKWKYLHYGGDKESFPMMAYIFVMLRQNFQNEIDRMPIHNLIGCQINMRTLQVFNPQPNQYPELILQKLNKQRLGRYSVPNVPAKPDIQPGLFGVTPNININADATDVMQND